MKKIASIFLGLSLGVSISMAQTYEWTAGQLGGGWYTMAAGLAKIIQKDNPDIKIKVVPGGGTTNPSKVQKGKSQLGLGLDTILFLAANGKDIYRNKHNDISMIGMGLSDIIFHVIAAKDAKYNNLGDLLKNGKNEKIAVTKPGSSDEKIFSWIMKYYGTSYRDLKKRGFRIVYGNYSENASQYKDGLVDYVIVNLGVPGAAVIDMLISKDGKLLDLPDDLLANLKKEWGYNKGKLVAKTYKGQNKDVVTGVMSTAFFVSNKLPEDMVYKMTKAICENESQLENIHSSMKNFSCKKAFVNSPIPLHPGAKKYYKEKGYIK